MKDRAADNAISTLRDTIERYEQTIDEANETIENLNRKIEELETKTTELEVSVGNFPAITALLGLKSDLGDMGSMSIAEARRAVIRARATFDRKASELVREPSTEYGAPRTREDGTVELHPVRVFSGGLDRDRLASYVDRFAALTEGLAARGATRIAWA